jgi:Flp pilus assembly protein TadB
MAFFRSMHAWLKNPYLVPGLIVLGLCMLALGWAWSSIRAPAAYWSEEQAAEYSTAQAQLHAISHSHSHDPGHEQVVAAARDRFLDAQQQLDDARGARNRTGMLFLAAGMTTLLVAIFLHKTAGSSA